MAPVTVGAGAVTGAGTTVYRDVPPGALALTRPEFVIVEGWAERKRQKMLGGGAAASKSARPTNGASGKARPAPNCQAKDQEEGGEGQGQAEREAALTVDIHGGPS